MDFNLKNAKLWFGLAFLLALALRLLRLGEVPLSDFEAGWALQALGLVRGQAVEFGPNPAYVNLTALSFFLLQATNFSARLAPALAGAFLVLAPYFFRDRLGAKPALALAFLLAFEPGLLAASRLAGSPIFALTFSLLAWGLWRNGSNRLAGALAGLALLSGSAFWVGLGGLLLTYALARLLMPEFSLSLETSRLRPALAYAVGVYLLAGSLFLLAPGGLGAGLAALTGLFGAPAAGGPFWLPLAAVLFYQFPALVLALITLLRLPAGRDERVILLGLWLFSALLLAVLLPSRQVLDVLWALIPLWALASFEIVRWLTPIAPVVELQTLATTEDTFELRPVTVSNGLWETLGMTVLTVTLLTFAWLNVLRAALVTFDPNGVLWSWVFAFSALALLGLSVVLVAFGWSARSAFQGFAWGGLAVLAVYSLAMASFSAQLRPRPSVEMWPPSPQAPALGILLEQANELSQLGRGSNAALNVMLVNLDSPALRWLFRDWRVISAQAVSFDSNPELILTPSTAIPPELESAYRGALMPWRAYPAWEQAILPDWLRWLVNHDLPQGQETLLLWARTDLFPDSQNTTP
jgi:hypothetical protein